MKRKSKAMGFLITGVALAAGIAISSGIIRNSYVADEAKAASAYSHTITAKTWDSYGAQTLSGVSWTAAATGGAYWGYDGTKGQQFGSGNSPAKPLTLSTSDINGSISSISISTSGASSVSATIGVSVGGSQYGDSPKNITASNATYTFSGNATGEIIFTWTQTSSKALYLKAIEIEYSSKTLSSLSVSGTPTKTSYYAGESFNPAGLTITANYNDESSADVTSECTFSPNPLTAGMKIRAVYDVGPTNDDYVAYTYSPTSAFDSVGEKTITITSTENASAVTTLNVDVVAVSSLNITVADTGYTSTSYATTAKTFTKSNVEFSMVNFLKPSGTSNMQFRTGTTDAFSFHNSTALPGIISKVTVQNVSGSPSSMTLYTGVSTQASSTSGGIAAAFNSSDKTFSWDVNTAEQSKYLRLFNFTGSSACIFSDIEIEFFAEPEANEDAIAWGTDFLSATAAGCSALDQSQLLTAWSGLETSFNALSSEAKNYLTSLTPNVTGNDAQHAVARYIYIISKYGDTTFADFMNLDIQAAPSVFDLLDDGYNYVPLIAVIGVVGLTVIIGYYYLKKRQEA